MAKTDDEVLREVQWHLERAEAQLSIAISIFAPRCGGIRYMIGSWGDYKKAVGTLFRLRHFLERVKRAQRYTTQPPATQEVRNE
ncbi:hypothetical protein [Ralstonia insidiosa]|uniref:hypothetical protein n=1 Tax=Ralstonia insidiosa TaxID=190721 RepID=UPI000CEF5835|nr:hypothetical protein [Ralstonia insidiosa]